MPQNLVADGSHVFRNHVAAALDEGVGLGGHGQRDAGTRGSAVGNEVPQLLETVFFRGAGGIDDIHDVTLDLLVHVHVLHHLAGADDVFRLHHGLGLGEAAAVVHADNLALLVLLGVGDHHLEHETVHLGLRQGIGALLLDGVLGGHHQEGFREFVGVVADGDLVLLHGFQQGALHLGRGTVDFIGQDEVGEDGALVHLEAFVLLGIDQGTHHVGREEVRGELDAAELGVNGL